MNKKLTVHTVTLLAVSFLSISLLCGCLDAYTEEHHRQVKFAADPEFAEQEDGLAALEAHYGFHFDVVYEMAMGLTHEALRAGDVDAAKGFATDGKIKELDLINLEDDKKFFPASNCAPVIRAELLEQYPELEKIMAEITSRLDNDTMIYLNYLVDLEEYTPADVARVWLQEEGLITEPPKDTANREQEHNVVVGSKHFAEQRILAHIAIIALEYGGIPAINLTELGDTAANRFALEQGIIHMYWEYTETAWKAIHERQEAIHDAEELYQRVAQKDLELGLVWLDYAPFDNTCTVMMRHEHAAELGISNISELAAWVKQVQAENS